MKATCEVVVERELLLTAISANSTPIALLAPDQVEIGTGSFGITVSTASIACELQAVGDWDRLVLAQRYMMEALLSRNSRPTVKLLFVGNVLFVDQQPVAAEDLGPVTPFGARRPSRVPGPPRQGSLALPEPGARLRSARPQLPARGLPLFT